MSGLTKRDDEGGFTLIELLVVMVVLGVVGGVVVAGLVSAMQSSQEAKDRIHAMAELQRTAENVARELRAACPLEVAEDDRVGLVVNRGGDLVEHRYYVNADADALRHEVDDQDASNARTLVHDLEMGSTPVFDYFKLDGDATSIPTEARSIRLTLRRDPGWDADPIEVTTLVQVRNGGRSCQ